MEDIDREINRCLRQLLLKFSFEGNLDKIKYLVEKKEAQPILLPTKNIEIVDYMLTYGADIDEGFDYTIVNDNGNCIGKYMEITLLSFACIENHINLINFLLTNGADINKDKSLHLYNTDNKFLIKAGYNFTVQPYDFLKYKYNFKYLEYLCDNNLSDVNYQNKKGNNILMILFSIPYCSDIVRRIVNKTNINLNTINEKGETALILCSKTFFYSIECLVKSGKPLDKNIKDKEGKTALNYFEEMEKTYKGNEEIILKRIKEIKDMLID